MSETPLVEGVSVAVTVVVTSHSNSEQVLYSRPPADAARRDFDVEDDSAVNGCCGRGLAGQVKG